MISSAYESRRMRLQKKTTRRYCKRVASRLMAPRAAFTRVASSRIARQRQREIQGYIKLATARALKDRSRLTARDGGGLVIRDMAR